MRRKAAKYRDFRRIGSCIKNAIFQGMRGREGECAGADSAAFDFFCSKNRQFRKCTKNRQLGAPELPMLFRL